MTTSSTIVVRRATLHDVADIVRLALEVQDVHVAGHPDLFKPGGVEPHAEIATRVTTPGQFYWVATLPVLRAAWVHAVSGAHGVGD